MYRSYASASGGLARAVGLADFVELGFNPFTSI